MSSGIINALLDIIYPKTCLACKRNLKGIAAVDNLVCRECWGKIKRNLPPFCYSCGRHLENSYLAKHICGRCVKIPLRFDRAFSPCVYEGVTKDLIHEFKYKGKDYLGHALSRLMIDFIKEYDLPIEYMDAVVPVPLHKTRLREREFNQAEILSEHIAREFGKEVLGGNLIRHRPTRTQTELETEERFLNVSGSFSLKDSRAVRGKNILLVDDVLTTAATSSEAASVLKNSGAQIVYVLTLAN